jgi:hypothetical protein
VKDTLTVINQMQADGIISKYAIGGAIATTFYLEPTSTFDIDIFISFEDVPPGSLVSLAPIYDYLKSLGCRAEHEHVVVGGWPVQFLPADDTLTNEALLQALGTTFQGVKTWVMTAEHLMAIALRTGRGKDLIRIDQFLNSKVFDDGKLGQILARHGLLEKWKQFTLRYGGYKG